MPAWPEAPRLRRRLQSAVPLLILFWVALGEVTLCVAHCQLWMPLLSLRAQYSPAHSHSHTHGHTHTQIIAHPDGRLSPSPTFARTNVCLVGLPAPEPAPSMPDLLFLLRDLLPLLILALALTLIVLRWQSSPQTRLRSGFCLKPLRPPIE